MSDTTDDMEIWLGALEASMENRTDEWFSGMHITREGKKIALKDMTKEHLENTIRHFDGYNTSALEKELAERD